MRNLFAVLFCLICIPSVVLANGSPIDTSDVHAVGNIRMIQKKDISLVEEELNVSLEGDFAVVRATYQLINQGPKDTVSYGFPVDYDICPEGLDCAEKPEDSEPSLQHVTVESNGTSLKVIEYDESKSGDNHPDFRRTWISTDLEFDAKEQKTVTVSYSVMNSFTDWIYTKSFKPKFSFRRFKYLLSPSGNWGDGIVKRLNISIDCSKITSKGGTIDNIEPSGYTKNDHGIRWKFVDFDLTKADDIIIDYNDSIRLMSDYVVSERLPERCIRKVTCSSSLNDTSNTGRYDITNVLDNDLDTAWSEGIDGDGIGQTLTFELNKAVVAGIGIINGYVKSEGIYQANNRIKSIKVTTVKNNGDIKEATVNLPKRNFNVLNRLTVAPFIDWIADFGDPIATTKSITLTIQEVYPGSKYRDTCISEVYLIGFTYLEKSDQ